MIATASSAQALLGTHGWSPRLASAPPAPDASSTSGAAEEAPKKGAVRRAMHWVNEMSSPKESTQGDFDGPAWFQAGFQSSVEGFYLGGLAASGGCLAASMTGLWVGEKTKSQTLACLTGASVAAGVMGGLAHAGGPALYVPAAITGALLGAFVTFRGNAHSRVRDSAGNAAMLAGPFIHGPSKVAAGLGAAAAQKIGGSATRQALIGGVVSGGLGVALSAIGFAPMGMLGMGLVCGTAGALGPSFGPRFSQFFRNLSLTLGDHMVAGAQTVGIVKEAPSRKMTNVVGAIPSSFAKEGFRACVLADFSLTAFFLGGAAESIQQMDIFLHQKGDDKRKGQASPPAPSPQPHAAPPQPATAPSATASS